MLYLIISKMEKKIFPFNVTKNGDRIRDFVPQKESRVCWHSSSTNILVTLLRYTVLKWSYILLFLEGAPKLRVAEAGAMIQLPYLHEQEQIQFWSNLSPLYTEPSYTFCQFSYSTLIYLKKKNIYHTILIYKWSSHLLNIKKG